MGLIIGFVLLCALLYGRSIARANRALHIRIMSVVIAGDLALIVYLVRMRHVLNKINAGMSYLLIFHIVLAVSLLLFYAQAVRVGLKLRHNEIYRPKMRSLDRIIVTLRVLVWLTSLWLVLSH